MISRVLATVFRNPELRRLELAFVGFNAAEWGTWIAMLVYAYEQGGATTAGLVALAQLVPAGLFAPFAAVLADRRGPAWMLTAGYLAQAATMGATGAALLAGAPSLLVYALAALGATSVTMTRPAQAALAPSLARSADELTATNVVSGWIESFGVLVAPAAAGVLLGVSGPGTVYAVMAGVALASALLAAGLPRGTVGAAVEEEGVLEEAVAGFRLLAKEPEPRVLVALLAAQFIGLGALDVLYVVLALGVLDMGESGVGYLNAAFGAGGVLGIAVTAALVGRPRLAPPLLAGVLVWVVALWLLAGYATTIAAIVLLAAAGAGRSLLDVAGRTLLQRTAPLEVLSRVFGVLEGLSMAGLALGSLLVPLLVAVGGAEAALIGVGAVLPLVALAAGRRLLELDRLATVPVVEIALLRSVPTFAPLGAPELERLARGLKQVDVPAGTVFMREGESGDHAYLVADGELQVMVGDQPLVFLVRSDIVGEIALLRGSARTATVVARSDARLYELDRDGFLETFAGSRAAAGAMEALIDRRLGETAQAGGRIPP
jgi:MFS family permease